MSDEITKPSNLPLPDDFYDKAIGADMGEVVYTDDKSDRPIAASYGAGSCVIVAAWNPETKKTALCHVGAMTDLHGLSGMLHKIRGETGAKIQVHLAGSTGERTDEKTAKEINERLSYLDSVEIKTANLGGDAESESLAIDARNGNVYIHFEAPRIKMAIDPNLGFQRVPSRNLHEVYGGYGIEGKEADIALAVNEALRQKDGSWDKEISDVLKLLHKKGNALENNKEELIKELGELSPNIGPARVKEIEEKFIKK